MIPEGHVWLGNVLEAEASHMSSVGLREEGAPGRPRVRGARGESEVQGSLTSGLSLVSWVFIKESAFSAFPEDQGG